MLRKLLSNKIVFVAVVLAFALAMGVSAAYGKTTAAEPAWQRQTLSVAMDPPNPPDVWL